MEKRGGGGRKNSEPDDYGDMITLIRVCVYVVITTRVLYYVIIGQAHQTKRGRIYIYIYMV